MKFFNVYYNIKHMDDIPETEIDDIFNVGVFNEQKNKKHKAVVKSTKWIADFKSNPGVNVDVFLEEIFEYLVQEEDYEVTYMEETK